MAIYNKLNNFGVGGARNRSVVARCARNKVEIKRLLTSTCLVDGTNDGDKDDSDGNISKLGF